ncbi:MAG: aldehyde dehydrogenase [Hyphomonadaceae bacterium]|nr:MAG: aldehyde dehydrogenase [Hyphomonadaceae bacterium]
MNAITSKSPIDGAILGQVNATPLGDIDSICENAHLAHLKWRKVPAPRRGELVRIWGEVLRARKQEIADMVSLEAGKITSEALGEVQEMIDICDFAVGLSRQLHGLTIQSERVEHHLLERWKPLGVVGIISAFNSRSCRCRRGNGCPRKSAASFSNWLDPYGQTSGAGVCRGIKTQLAGTWRQWRNDSAPKRGFFAFRASHNFRRRRHCWPKMHDFATLDCAFVG